MNTRNLTIGFITSDIEDNINNIYIKSIHEYAQKNGVKLITLPCGKFNSKKLDDYKKNVVFDIIDTKLFDGFIAWTSNIFSNTQKEEAEKIFSKISSKPVVCIQLKLSNHPTILFDNYKGMKKVITHLIEVHNLKKIAFLKGPENHIGAMERFKAYIDTLDEYKIAIDNRLISEPGAWYDRGKEFIDFLIQKNSLKPEDDFNAIACSSSPLAKEVIKELQLRSIKVPHDVAVTGFDDNIAKLINPGITNANFDYYNTGKIAIDLLIRCINEDLIQKEILIEPELILRSSCGCLDRDIIDFVEEKKTQRPEIIASAKNNTFNKSLVITNVINSINYSKINSRFIEKLLNLILSNINEEITSPLLQSIDDILNELITFNTDEFTIKKSIINLVNETSKYIPDKKRSLNFLMLCEHTMTLLLSKKERNLNYKYFLKNVKQDTINTTGQKLITSNKLKELIKILQSEIEKCGINWLCLYTYENPEKPKDKVKLITAYDGTRDIRGEYKEEIISTYMIFSKKYLPETNFYNICVNNLYCNEENIGLLLFNIKDPDFLNYNIIINQIASSLKAKILIKELETSKSSIKERSMHIETLVIPMLSSIKKIAGLAQEKMQKMINLKNITENGHKKMKITKNFIDIIYANINKMSDLINIIDSISASVKILAINASITSMQSGEHGESFAIIAKEIRTLSEKTKANADEIFELLSKVIQETIVSKKHSNDAYFGFTDIKKGVNEIVNYLSEVSERMNILNDTGNSILNILDIKK